MVETPLSLEQYSSRMKLPSRLQRSNNIAASILKHFDRHFSIFMELTRTARTHFEQGDWPAGRATISERISLYDKRVNEAISDLQKNY